MFNQKLFALRGLVGFELLEGIEVKENNRIISAKAEFNFMNIIFKNFLECKVHNKFNDITYKELSEVRDIFGINRQKSFDRVINESLFECVTDILNIIKILTSFDDEIELIKSVKLRNIHIPIFILELVRMVNSLKMTNSIKGTNSFIVFESITINFIDKNLGSKDYHSVNGLLVSLKKVNSFLKLVDEFSFTDVKESKEFFEESQFDMNISCESVITNNELKSVKLEVGRDHTKEDLEMSLLSLVRYKIPDKENLDIRVINLNDTEVFNCLSYEFTSYKGSRDYIAGSKIKINKIYNSIYSSNNKNIDKRNFVRKGKEGELRKTQIELNVLSDE